MKNRKVQVYCVLGSKVSSVVAEHLEHSLPGQTQAPARLIFAPSIVRLDPRTAQGSALKPKPNPICTQSRVKRVSAPDSLQTRREAEDADRATRGCLLSHALMI